MSTVDRGSLRAPRTSGERVVLRVLRDLPQHLDGLIDPRELDCRLRGGHQERAGGDGHTNTVLKVKLNPLDRFVEMGGKLAKLRLFEDRVRVSGDIFAKLDEGRKRIAEAAEARRERESRQPLAE